MTQQQLFSFFHRPTTERKELIVVADEPHEFTGHPAKLHQDLARQLIEDYSSNGDTVLDPFAGIGTVPRIASALHRVGVGIEIEPAFVDRAAEIGIELLLGDSSVYYIRHKVDLIISSPPYGEMIGRGGDRDPKKTARAKLDYEMRRFGKHKSSYAEYGSEPGNIGTMPFTSNRRPSFSNAFRRVVTNILPSLVSGGRCVWVVKDQRRGRRRLGAIDMFAFVRETCESVGCIYEGRRVALLPDRMTTQWQRVNERRWGIPIQNVEHICVMRKP